MAYTPIGWQTGDTITAEKLNKMDNGWGVETTEQVCFDGSVTTTEEYNSGNFEPDTTFISNIVVTFNGNEYECQNNGDDSYPEYGAPYNSDSDSIDFSTYPFHIFGNGSTNYILVTETAGTYTLNIKAVEEGIETSANFKNAVNQCTPKMLRCIEYETTIKDARSVISAGGILYFTAQNTMGNDLLFFINEVNGTCTIIPESTEFSAGFDRDGMFVIYHHSGE